jgi:hypothetical protein
VPATPAPAIPRDVTIKAVEAAVQAGYDYLKAVLNTTQNGPEVETLKLIVAEGKKHNKPTIVHAVSVRDNARRPRREARSARAHTTHRQPR